MISGGLRFINLGKTASSTPIKNSSTNNDSNIPLDGKSNTNGNNQTGSIDNNSSSDNEDKTNKNNSNDKKRLEDKSKNNSNDKKRLEDNPSNRLNNDKNRIASSNTLSIDDLKPKLTAMINTQPIMNDPTSTWNTIVSNGYKKLLSGVNKSNIKSLDIININFELVNNILSYLTCVSISSESDQYKILSHFDFFLTYYVKLNKYDEIDNHFNTNVDKYIYELLTRQIYLLEQDIVTISTSTKNEAVPIDWDSYDTSPIQQVYFDHHYYSIMFYKAIIDLLPQVKNPDEDDRIKELQIPYMNIIEGSYDIVMSDSGYDKHIISFILRAFHYKNINIQNNSDDDQNTPKTPKTDLITYHYPATVMFMLISELKLTNSNITPEYYKFVTKGTELVNENALVQIYKNEPLDFTKEYEKTLLSEIGVKLTKDNSITTLDIKLSSMNGNFYVNNYSNYYSLTESEPIRLGKNLTSMNYPCVKYNYKFDLKPTTYLVFGSSGSGKTTWINHAISFLHMFGNLSIFEIKNVDNKALIAEALENETSTRTNTVYTLKKLKVGLDNILYDVVNKDKSHLYLKPLLSTRKITAGGVNNTTEEKVITNVFVSSSITSQFIKKVVNALPLNFRSDAAKQLSDLKNTKAGYNEIGSSNILFKGNGINVAAKYIQTILVPQLGEDIIKFLKEFSIEVSNKLNPVKTGLTTITDSMYKITDTYNSNTKQLLTSRLISPSLQDEVHSTIIDTMGNEDFIMKSIINEGRELYIINESTDIIIKSILDNHKCKPFNTNENFYITESNIALLTSPFPDAAKDVEISTRDFISQYILSAGNVDKSQRYLIYRYPIGNYVMNPSNMSSIKQDTKLGVTLNSLNETKDYNEFTNSDNYKQFFILSGLLTNQLFTKDFTTRVKPVVDSIQNNLKTLSERNNNTTTRGGVKELGSRTEELLTNFKMTARQYYELSISSNVKLVELSKPGRIERDKRFIVVLKHIGQVINNKELQNNLSEVLSVVHYNTYVFQSLLNTKYSVNVTDINKK
jgi:hypothetical protein